MVKILLFHLIVIFVTRSWSLRLCTLVVCLARPSTDTNSMERLNQNDWMLHFYQIQHHKCRLIINIFITVNHIYDFIDRPFAFKYWVQLCKIIYQPHYDMFALIHNHVV